MPDLSTLALFAVAALALTMSPGPDMLLIASRSMSQGRGAGFATLAGIQVGTYCHAVAAALGLSQLFLAVPVVWLNRPRFVVPPPQRADPGALAEWRAARRR